MLPETQGHSPPHILLLTVPAPSQMPIRSVLVGAALVATAQALSCSIADADKRDCGTFASDQASCEASGSVQKGGYRRALVDLDVVAGAVQQRSDRAQVLG